MLGISEGASCLTYGYSCSVQQHLPKLFFTVTRHNPFGPNPRGKLLEGMNNKLKNTLLIVAFISAHYPIPAEFAVRVCESDLN